MATKEAEADGAVAERSRSYSEGEAYGFVSGAHFAAQWTGTLAEMRAELVRRFGRDLVHRVAVTRSGEGPRELGHRYDCIAHVVDTALEEPES